VASDIAHDSPDVLSLFSLERWHCHGLDRITCELGVNAFAFVVEAAPV
jgi:hypothetical protein